MRHLYTLLMMLVWPVLQALGTYKPKLKLFTQGRKQTFDIMQKKLSKNTQKVWFHAASLGEFEQGLPVMEAWKQKHPTQQIVVSFFSPSGYEIRKNHPIADVVVYLPWDVPSKVNEFLNFVQPSHVFLIKYEFWPNLLHALHQRNIPTYLISGIFRPKQVFFKPYGFWMRKYLNIFDHFFVQNEISEKLLNQIGLTNVTISGDTRYDRVAKIYHQNEVVGFVETFKNNQPLIVIGSSWEADEKLWITYLQQPNIPWKILIAPHNINTDSIKKLKNNIPHPTVLFSQKESANLAEAKVLILDTIGWLSKIYKYAQVAYVGGGFGHPGVHNVLEPAVFGIPIMVGPNYHHFPEAVALMQAGGMYSISQIEELKKWLKEWEQNEKRQLVGKRSFDFVHQQIGATDRIMRGFSD